MAWIINDITRIMNCVYCKTSVGSLPHVTDKGSIDHKVLGNFERVTLPEKTQTITKPKKEKHKSFLF